MTLTHRKVIGVMLFLSSVGLTAYGSATAASPATPSPDSHPLPPRATIDRFALQTISAAPFLPEDTIATPKRKRIQHETNHVPFYSQFTDISSPSWQKVGCGIASLAMLIDYYTEETHLDVDALLKNGIARGAYIDDAGWSHAGLITLADQYDLTGESKSLSHLSLDAAFTELENVVKTGPVMVSVHYTFEPTNPIPHLVVISGVDGDEIIYSDPAETTGNRRLSAEKFKRSWKKRYIEIRPTGA